VALPWIDYIFLLDKKLILQFERKQYNMIGTSHRSKQQTFFLILMLGALNTITPFSIDMYLPGFPEIARDLHTSIGNVALSVSTYFLGFAVGQIMYGPLLDRFGRKRPLYIGLGLYIAASVGCIAFHSINGLLLFRFIQALTGCVASVAAMAMVRDFFPVKESARIISLLVLILGASPLLAPTIGSFIVTTLGWQWVFVLLALIVLIIQAVIFFFLPEGHPPDTSVSLKPEPIIKGFKDILLKRRFCVYALAGTFSFAGLFVYVAGSPAIFMEGFHVSARVYGGIFALLSVGFIGGSQLNHLLSRRWSSEKIFETAVIVQVAAAMIFFVGVYNEWYGLMADIVCLFILLLCTGLTYPNAAAIAMAPFSKNAGSASALLGFIQIGIGGLISSGAGILHFKGSLSTAITMAVSSVLALIILLAGRTGIDRPVINKIRLSKQKMTGGK
jgi:DHA1 family bicyclomycin/chloramphenicol resistance-like MFS transporter